MERIKNWFRRLCGKPKVYVVMDDGHWDSIWISKRKALDRSNFLVSVTGCNIVVLEKEVNL